MKKYIIQDEDLFALRACMRIHLEDMIGLHNSIKEEENREFVKNTIQDLKAILDRASNLPEI
ncbi:hypothetical protein EBZ39_17350 [bacterium]|nr:hypothetical protein [bacterium]